MQTLSSAANDGARPSADHDNIATARTAWMRELALADGAALAAAFDVLSRTHDLPRFRVIRAPETGMAMVRGRAGGNGAPFNLGEMTVTRCALALPNGELGLAYVQGRNRQHAEHAAFADALLQTSDWHAITQAAVLAPLQTARATRAARRAAENAASRVDFFTLARGDAEDDVGDAGEDNGVPGSSQPKAPKG
ncbi:phosphonate C-P lyase system protein PhnG [Robbsia andropogonis]|uniref:phosphonate C-P lyase system protein PhnG n=1 Tax=Robbsia andropogonis TaxID=28092 RepID=UPI000466F5FB|nr:phosphonate C-P lyase system protein PhnG [Robbsia andropogonis]